LNSITATLTAAAVDAVVSTRLFTRVSDDGLGMRRPMSQTRCTRLLRLLHNSVSMTGPHESTPGSSGQEQKGVERSSKRLRLTIAVGRRCKAGRFSMSSGTTIPPRSPKMAPWIQVSSGFDLPKFALPPQFHHTGHSTMAPGG